MQSESINELAEALAVAQSEIKNPTKNKTAKIASAKGGFQYHYADIADVLTSALPVLSKHGLSIVQPTALSDGMILLRTRLMHKSGQWIESEYPVCNLNGGDHKSMGAAMTYARRYALTSLIGVAADEDTDGEGAAGVRKSSAQTKRDGDFDKLRADLADVQSAVGLETLRKEYENNVYPAWPKRWVEEAAPELFEARAAELSSGADLRDTLEASAEAETRAEYIRNAHDFIAKATDGDALLRWWNSDVEKATRRRLGLSKQESDALKERVLAKRAELAPNVLAAG